MSQAAATASPAVARRGPRQRRRCFRDLRDERLLERYHDDADLAAREQLIERFLPLARRLASRYSHTAEPHDDLVQVACVGLVKSVDRFEPERGTTFVNYAVPNILGELRRHFRDKGWAVRVPRPLQERALEVGQAISRLTTRLGRSPSAKEIAKHLGASTEEVLEGMEAATAYGALSLDSRPPAGDDDEPRGYADTVATDEQGYERVELGQALSGAVRALSERERRILHLRFVEDLTQSEIAERVGISQMHVSRLLRRAVARLRAAN